MIRRILLAVDDSAPALAAAGFAVELARSLSAELRAVTVIEPEYDPEAVLGHVRSLAERRGVPISVASVDDGTHPFEVLLATAIDWDADLVVMGRSDTRPTGRPYVGSQTEHVLEFTEVPVVVVPEASTRWRRSDDGPVGAA